MIVHVVVSVMQGCAEGVAVVTTKEEADAAEAKMKTELEIVPGHEEESDCQVEVFYNVHLPGTIIYDQLLPSPDEAPMTTCPGCGQEYNVTEEESGDYEQLTDMYRHKCGHMVRFVPTGADSIKE